MALTLKLLDMAKAKGVNLVLPTDNMIADDFNNQAKTQVVASGQIPDNWEGLDIGPESIKTFSDILKTPPPPTSIRPSTSSFHHDRSCSSKSAR